MLEIGQVSKRLRTRGYVCVVDRVDKKAVRLEQGKSGTRVFIKRKGQEEVRSLLSEDSVQDVINNLYNDEITRKEYDEY